MNNLLNTFKNFEFTYISQHVVTTVNGLVTGDLIQLQGTG